MTFLNPLVLIALAAAAIPVILHLLNLRKLKSVEFSTLRFLKELQKTKIRRLKLKQILLLILRTLIIIFLVLAFSRPTIQGYLPVVGTYSKTSAIILIDNSFSMDVSDAYGNRLNQAKNAALGILTALKDGDEAAIVMMTDKGSGQENLTRNLNFLREEISKLKISNHSANLYNSLRKAAGIFEKANNLNKEVYVITDAQSNIFLNETADSIRLFDNSTTSYFIPVGTEGNAEIQNLSVDSIGIITRIFQKDKLVEVEAGIRNNSEKEVKGMVVSMFFNGQRVAQRTIDVPGNSVKPVSISAPSQTFGAVRAYIEIEGDALETDNRRYFSFIVPEKPSVALVGNPENSKYISLALGGKSTFESPAQLSIFSELSSINFSNFELVILAGMQFREGDLQRLEQYIKNGGAALLFADDKLSPDQFNLLLSRLGLGTFKENNFSQSQPAAFISVDKNHPLFEGVFKGTTESKSIVESPKIYKAYTTNSGQGIIEMPGGSFLSEARLQDGKIIYCAVSPTLTWSSLPFTGLFPTLLHRSIYYLSAHSELGESIITGVPYMLSIPRRYATGGNFRINDPNGSESFKQSNLLPTGAVLSFDDIEQTGVYIISTPEGNLVTTIAANTNPTESILTPLTKDAIIKAMKSHLDEAARLEIVNDAQQIAQNIDRARTGSELWQLFLILALLTIIAEMLVARNTKQETTE